MKRISVLTPCYNEEGNVRELVERIRAVFAGLPQYQYEHIFIDNASTDGTAAALKQLAAEDPRVKVIFNNRNFGHIRSPFHGLLQCHGDAVISLASDLQDPPELITEFLQKWEAGIPVVVGQKIKSEESPLFYGVRSLYYKVAKALSETELLEHVTGFGLYDQKVITAFRNLGDAYPYVRGLICELGFAIAIVPYEQPARKRGLTKNNFYTLYDMAMLGVTSHSKVPLRLATMLGFAMSLASFLTGLGYLAYKLVRWDIFNAGIAPLVIGVFFVASVQLLFLGILGEYVGFIHTQVLNRPLVTERERIGFEEENSPVAS